MRVIQKQTGPAPRLRRYRRDNRLLLHAMTKLDVKEWFTVQLDTKDYTERRVRCYVDWRNAKHRATDGKVFSARLTEDGKLAVVRTK